MPHRTLALGAIALLGSLALAACGSTIKVTATTGTGAGGGAGSTASTGNGGAASSSASTTSASSSASSGSTCPATQPLTGACAPPAACQENGSVCLGSVSQSASTTPGFRMLDLTFSVPAAFTTTTVLGGIVTGASTPEVPTCNLSGTGGVSWLVRFDLGAGTLETGGAKPVASSAGPYAFDDEMIQEGATTFHVQPTTLTGPLTSNCAFSSGMGDVLFPIFLDEAGTNVVLVPFHGLQLTGSTSADLGCIGRFNSQGLQPSNNCLPDSQHPAFVDVGKVSASIRLEDADTVLVAALNETLCVLLSQNSADYAFKTAAGFLACKRDANNNIVFQGDWCSTTNQPGGCADALQVAATFAAQAVTIQ